MTWDKYWSARIISSFPAIMLAADLLNLHQLISEDGWWLAWVSSEIV